MWRCMGNGDSMTSGAPGPMCRPSWWGSRGTGFYETPRSPSVWSTCGSPGAVAAVPLGTDTENWRRGGPIEESSSDTHWADRGRSGPCACSDWRSGASPDFASEDSDGFVAPRTCSVRTDSVPRGVLPAGSELGAAETFELRADTEYERGAGWQSWSAHVGLDVRIGGSR